MLRPYYRPINNAGQLTYGQVHTGTLEETQYRLKHSVELSVELIKSFSDQKSLIFSLPSTDSAEKIGMLVDALDNLRGLETLKLEVSYINFKSILVLLGNETITSFTVTLPPEKDIVSELNLSENDKNLLLEKLENNYVLCSLDINWGDKFFEEKMTKYLNRNKELMEWIDSSFKQEHIAAMYGNKRILHENYIYMKSLGHFDDSTIRQILWESRFAY